MPEEGIGAPGAGAECKLLSKDSGTEPGCVVRTASAVKIAPVAVLLVVWDTVLAM